MDDDFDLALPDFLNRKLWSKEQIEVSEAKRKELIFAHNKRIEQDKREGEARLRQAKAEKAAANERRLERKAQAIKREAKKKAKASTLNAALNFALQEGTITTTSLEKMLIPELKPYAKWAVRDLFKRGELKRVSRKVYKL